MNSSRRRRVRRYGEVSLRWIYVHVIEGTARHAGHADILRELTDGAAGVV
ncbi:mycothiol transferase [Geodermatophilus sp. URMC 65]